MNIEKAANGYYFIVYKSKRLFNRDFLTEEDAESYIKTLTKIQLDNVAIIINKQ